MVGGANARAPRNALSTSSSDVGAGDGKATFNIANKGLRSMAGITITNNRLDHTASTGRQILYTTVTTIVLSGNVFDDTGLPVKALNTGTTT